jgi:predicted transcriptional regulator of viral defense system
VVGFIIWYNGPEIIEKINELMSSQDGYARARELHEKDIHSVYLTELVASGFLVRLKRGLYTIAEGTGRSELVEVQKAIPSGIFCLTWVHGSHRKSTSLFGAIIEL